MTNRAVVVGGTRRVGRWVSEALLAAGWAVHALYRSDAAAAAQLEAELGSAELPFSSGRVDATTATTAGEYLPAAWLAEPQPLRLLVNAAGPAARGPLAGMDSGALEALWRGNVLTVHNAVRALLPQLQQPGAGIINFISAGNDSLRAYRELPAYSACKSMLLSYSRSLARELAPQGIAVNCIALGVTELSPEGVPALAADNLPSGRYIGQEDVARAIWYLAGEAAASLTGSVLNLGGGFGL